MADSKADRPGPPWDAERAAALVGKVVLIGLTYRDSNQQLIEQKQLHGTILSADPRKGITVQLRGAREGEVFRLPPHLASIQDARPGEYHLRSTGETIVDPDLVTTWTVDAPPPGGDAKSA